MSALAPVLKLANGQEIPKLGLGTWKSPPGKVYQAVKDAITLGYRHLDCAFAYQNENEVGDAVKEVIEKGIVKREDIFITSKDWNTYHTKDRVVECCRKSLEALKTPYLDLYLIHWPTGFEEGDAFFPTDESGRVLISDVDYLETWQGMEECHRLGLVRSIGLSNFNSKQIQRVYDNSTIKPVVLQVECHPYFNQNKLINFCKNLNIIVTAYSPLGSPDRPFAKPGDPSLLDDSKIKAIAEKYKKSPAQIIIKFQVQRDVIVIPKSITKHRIEENLNIFDFELSEDDMTTIENFDRDHRFLGLEICRDHPLYPFNMPY